MSVIIRLQNLPWTANALDIRRFFSGLAIPDGGVHIVGGEKGDAFIAFTTDEDARRAMLLDGGRIGTNALKLFLSSKTEMQNVIAIARGGAPLPGGGNQGPPPPMGGMPPQNQPFQPQQPIQIMPHQNFGPPPQQGYPQGGGMIPQQNLPNQGQMRGGMPMDQRQQGMPPQYGSPQPMEPMVPQGRPDERALWDNRDGDHRDRGDFGRREIVPGAFDRPRDIEPRGFNGQGPVDGGHMIDRPIEDYREPRPRHDNFRGPSPRRDRFSPPRDRFIDERRERRKRPFEPEMYVYVGNMATPLNYRDVRKFFTGLEIPRTGLKLINDRSGNRIGDAYVMFATEDMAKSALRMNGWMVGGREVRIRPCTMEEFDRAVDSYVPSGVAQNDRPMNKRPRSRSPSKNIDGLCIVLKNIPFSAAKKEIFRLLNGIKFAKGDASVNIEYSRDSRPTGVALLELFSDRDLEYALRLHRRCELNGRTIEVIHISENEYRERLDRSMKNAPKEMASPIRSKEVKDDIKSVEKRSERGRKSETMDTKKSEKSESRDKNGADGDESKFYCVKMHGIPFNADKSVIQKFFEGLEIANKGIRLVYLPNGKASHTCFVEFVSSGDCKKALAKDKQHIGSRYINISPVTKRQMMDDFHNLSDKVNGGATGPPAGSSSVANQVGKPGCVVGIQNLHFNATLEDILSFFKNFGPIENSVKMRYNKDGRPMGDAMLAFHSRPDAERAVAEMNRRVLMGRSVALALV